MILGWRWSLLSLLLSVAFITACGRPAVSSDRVLRDEGIVAALTLDPDPPRAGEVVATLSLADLDGQPVDGALVIMFPWLSSGVGETSARVAKPIGDGRYQSTLTLAAEGTLGLNIDLQQPWPAHVGHTQRLVFKFDVQS
ncbi:MAG: hypothetical protein HYX89_08710 [Chloroflexi bacterium]|nr:hypothetical protein [Chloroflexota bacterium]